MGRKIKNCQDKLGNVVTCPDWAEGLVDRLFNITPTFLEMQMYRKDANHMQALYCHYKEAYPGVSWQVRAPFCAKDWVGLLDNPNDKYLGTDPDGNRISTRMKYNVQYPVGRRHAVLKQADGKLDVDSILPIFETGSAHNVGQKGKYQSCDGVGNPCAPYNPVCWGDWASDGWKVALVSAMLILAGISQIPAQSSNASNTTLPGDSPDSVSDIIQVDDIAPGEKQEVVEEIKGTLEEIVSLEKEDPIITQISVPIPVDSMATETIRRSHEGWVVKRISGSTGSRKVTLQEPSTGLQYIYYQDDFKFGSDVYSWLARSTVGAIFPGVRVP